MRKLLGLTVIFAAILIFSGTAHAVTLYAGQYIVVGSVSVENDDEYIYVTYNTVEGWELTEIQLSVTSTFEAIPTNKKGPTIGTFAYKYEGTQAYDTYEFKIPLSEVGVGFDDEIYVAAHAVVEKTDMSIPEGDPEETAWAGGTEFDGSWAMWFTKTISEPTPPPVIPPGVLLW